MNIFIDFVTSIIFDPRLYIKLIVKQDTDKTYYFTSLGCIITSFKIENQLMILV